MEILGAGLLASGFRAYQHRHPDVVVFAKGVARSTSIDATEYERESTDLRSAIRRCLAEGRRLVYFSSAGAIYGLEAEPKSEGSPLRPSSDYGRHQASCEAAILESGVRHLVVRLPNVVGCCGNRRQLIPALVEQCLSGRVRVLREATRDLVGLGDTARIVDRLLEVGPDLSIVQVASGISTPVGDIVSMIQAVLGTGARVTVAAGGDRQAFDPGKLRRLLGSEAEFPPDYPRRLLHLYVPEIADSLRPAIAPGTQNH